MAGELSIQIPREKLAGFCRGRSGRMLSFSGPALGEDFIPGSGVDVRVEFEPGAKAGLITFAGAGRRVSPELEVSRTGIPWEGIMAPRRHLVHGCFRIAPGFRRCPSRGVFGGAVLRRARGRRRLLQRPGRG